MDARRIDALLAVHLFGWRLEPRMMTILSGYPPDNGMLCPVRHYSTTWEGMGQVVDAMREKGWRFVLRCWPDRVRGEALLGDTCTAGFQRGNGEFDRAGRANAATAPMAATLAALATLGVELPDGS